MLIGLTKKNDHNGKFCYVYTQHIVKKDVLATPSPHPPTHSG